ncbi:hypothetical protein FNV43_RR05823 [Rhamnella rubrinervis]|uniref:Uncharacterized protein n=1 Tax=Rhamnella rubrinervis TaxID=2594499 RepID=A0A8K0HM26_9ROSA|nr:hypothetical protein FNV43_RR05823 [Rhamnella rubrinervis]
MHTKLKRCKSPKQTQHIDLASGSSAVPHRCPSLPLILFSGRRRITDGLWRSKIRKKLRRSTAILRDAYGGAIDNDNALEQLRSGWTGDNLWRITPRVVDAEGSGRHWGCNGERNEPLRNYIQRFNDMKVEIMDCPDVVACNAFKRGLLPGTKIYDYMVRKKPRNLLQTLQKAQSFVILEEETELDMQRAAKEGVFAADTLRRVSLKAKSKSYSRGYLKQLRPAWTKGLRTGVREFPEKTTPKRTANEVVVRESHSFVHGEWHLEESGEKRRAYASDNPYQSQSGREEPTIAFHARPLLGCCTRDSALVVTRMWAIAPSADIGRQAGFGGYRVLEHLERWESIHRSPITEPL